MKWQSIIIAVMLLLPALVQAQETNNAYLILKPHELLPQRFKAPADIIKQIEEQKTQLSSIRFLSWQEFSLYGTPHTLVIWYDANPNMVSSQSFVIHTYYHDKSGWRFYSVDRNPSPISVAVDRKKKMFTFVDVVPIKTIQFKELTKPEKDGSKSGTIAPAKPSRLVAQLGKLDPVEKKLGAQSVALILSAGEERDESAILTLCDRIDYYDPKWDPSLGSLKPVEKSYPAVQALQNLGRPVLQEVEQRIQSETNPKRKHLLNVVRQRIEQKERRSNRETQHIDAGATNAGLEENAQQRRCGKGFNLTANKSRAGWVFFLSPNWNRSVRFDECTVATSVADTKEMLGTLASGQEVNWQPNSVDRALPDAVLKEIAEHCKKLGLVFTASTSTKPKEGQASLAASSHKMKPRQTLPAKFKTSQDIVRDMEIFAPLGKGSVWWQEFRFRKTLQLLVIWFDAAPPQMSSDRPVEYAYYHDGKNWRFHSTSRSRIAAVSVDPKKQKFVFLDSRGQQLKSIPFKDVYKEQIKKLLGKERNTK